MTWLNSPGAARHHLRRGDRRARHVAAHLAQPGARHLLLRAERRARRRRRLAGSTTEPDGGPFPYLLAAPAADPPRATSTCCWPRSWSGRSWCARSPCRSSRARPPLGVYEAIRKVPQDKLIVISADWDASTQAETGPQTTGHHPRLPPGEEAVRASSTCSPPTGAKLANDRALAVAKQYGAKYGVDWVQLGLQVRVRERAHGAREEHPGRPSRRTSTARRREAPDHGGA